MIIQTLPSGPLATNTYIVGCEETHKAAIIDPAMDCTEAVESFLNNKQLQPEMILLTHSHWDHIACVAPLKEKYNPSIEVHPLDAPNVEQQGADGMQVWIEFKGVKPDLLLEDNEIIKIGDLEFVVIHTPGHTPGSVCYYCEREKVLFSGDTLFRGTIGAISFPTSRPALMWDSLRKLSLLPPETKVYPGHGPSTTIGRESWLSNAKEKFGE